MLKQTNKNFIIFFALLIILVTSFPTISLANEGGTSVNTPLRDGRTVEEKAGDMFPGGSGELDAGLPTVSIDDASSWMERKGFEVIGFLQKFIQPFAVVIFILSGITVLAGSFGNGKLVSQGLFGMFIALIMYVVVLYAPEIMDSFLGWVQS